MRVSTSFGMVRRLFAISKSHFNRWADRDHTLRSRTSSNWSSSVGWCECCMTIQWWNRQTIIVVVISVDIPTIDTQVRFGSLECSINELFRHVNLHCFTPGTDWTYGLNMWQKYVILSRHTSCRQLVLQCFNSTLPHWVLNIYPVLSCVDRYATNRPSRFWVVGGHSGWWQGGSHVMKHDATRLFCNSCIMTPEGISNKRRYHCKH